MILLKNEFMIERKSISFLRPGNDVSVSVGSDGVSVSVRVSIGVSRDGYVVARFHTQSACALQLKQNQLLFANYSENLYVFTRMCVYIFFLVRFIVSFLCLFFLDIFLGNTSSNVLTLKNITQCEFTLKYKNYK